MLNHRTVQNPRAGIKLNTECKTPIKIISDQFSTNNIADQRKKAKITKAIFDAVVDFSYDGCISPLSC